MTKEQGNTELQHDQVHVVAGAKSSRVGAVEFVESVVAQSHDNQIPFSEPLKQVIRDLSRVLLAAPVSRSAPQLTALGYWLRPAAISRLQQQFEHGASNNTDSNNTVSNNSAPNNTAPNNTVKVARGLALQLPPENVDTLFVYSWVLSFLVGNSNVTRLPTSPNSIALWLVEQITDILQKHDQAGRQLFCYFDKNSSVSQLLSRHCDLRVVWGGDEKIASVSRDLIQPDGLSIGFSDRKSICVINTAAYNGLEAAEQFALAEKFYNDTFWFDQMGCGSPRLLVWVGSEQPPMDLFFNHLDKVIDKKEYRVEPGIAIGKLVFASEMMIDDVSRAVSWHRAEFVSLEANLTADVLNHVQGGGTLFYTGAAELNDVAKLARRDLQTISTFGFSQAEKVELAIQLNGNGGYRIVPVGEALNFDNIWDGLDLMQQFSRLIVVR